MCASALYFICSLGQFYCVGGYACLCVLLGGPSYAVGADGLTIAGQTYDEPGVSGPGWAAHALLLLAADRARTAASLACTPPMASLLWMPIGWMRPAPARAPGPAPVPPATAGGYKPPAAR